MNNPQVRSEKSVVYITDLVYTLGGGDMASDRPIPTQV